MSRAARSIRLQVDKGGDMAILWTIIVFVFVIGVLAVVAYCLFEMSPFARHTDVYRDPVTHKWLGEPPRLD
jgi:hypothetical protein